LSSLRLFIGRVSDDSLYRKPLDRRYASLSHFFIKLVFAAPASGLPFLSIALGSQASFVHFVMKLFIAAPAWGFPSLPTALLWHVSSARAEPKAKVDSTTAKNNRFMFSSHLKIASLLGHLVLNNPHDGREDGTAGASTDKPTDEGAEVKAASSRPGERRDQGLEQLTAKTASDGACNRISRRAEACILECAADPISTDDTADNLNDEVD
jgi:hypothetical protein